eukprot:4480396-Pleurochrysis_carterae.AAC.1
MIDHTPRDGTNERGKKWLLFASSLASAAVARIKTKPLYLINGFLYSTQFGYRHTTCASRQVEKSA